MTMSVHKSFSYVAYPANTGFSDTASNDYYLVTKKYVDDKLTRMIEEDITVTAGNGISVTDARTVSVNPKTGGGVGVSTDGVYVDFLTPGGLKINSNKLDVNLKASGGLLVDANGAGIYVNTGTSKDQIPVLGDGGKLPLGVIPDISFTNVYPATSKNGRLSLSTIQVGDVCIETYTENDATVTDTYMYISSTVNQAGTEANWVEITVNPSAYALKSDLTGFITGLSGTSGNGLTVSGATVSMALATNATAGTASFSEAHFSVSNGMVSLANTYALQSSLSTHVSDTTAHLPSRSEDSNSKYLFNNADGDLVWNALPKATLSNASTPVAGIAVFSNDHFSINTDQVVSLKNALPDRFATDKSKYLFNDSTGNLVWASVAAYSLPAATNNTLGGIKVQSGNGLEYSDQNVLSVGLATTAKAGTASFSSSHFSVSNGVVSLANTYALATDLSSHTSATNRHVPTPGQDDGGKYLCTNTAQVYWSSLVIPVATDVAVGGVKVGNGLRINESGVLSVNFPSQGRVYSIVGDGVNNTCTLYHDFGYNILVQVYDNAGKMQLVDITVDQLTSNVILKFATPPALDAAYRVAIVNLGSHTPETNRDDWSTTQ